MAATLTSAELAAKIALLDSIEGTFVHRQDTAAEIDEIVLAAGELAFTTDTNEIRRGDGTTPGGIFVCGGWSHHAYLWTSTPSTSYVNLISVPVGQDKVWEYRAIIRAAATQKFVGNLIVSPYSQTTGPIVGATNSPSVGPTVWTRKSYIYSVTGVTDFSITKHGWNTGGILQWGFGTNETINLGVASGDQYYGVEYSGVFNITDDDDSQLILQGKTPDGAVASMGIFADLSIRRIK
jgi:hypothetical protein